MLTVLVPLLLALAAPEPVPLPSAAPPAALKEIGHVEARSVCSAIVVHANSAIETALDNDRELALTINHLRTTDLDDDNEIKRRAGMNDLAELAARIRLAAAAGNGEIKRLRSMAAETTEPTRKTELKAFADALGGAIARQRKAGADLDRMLTIIDGRRSVEALNATDGVGQRMMITGDGVRETSTDPTAVMRRTITATAPEPVDGVLRGVADDFQARTVDILSDEGVAADHSLGATTGC